jgi:hypothetical protein
MTPGSTEIGRARGRATLRDACEGIVLPDFVELGEGLQQVDVVFIDL